MKYKARTMKLRLPMDMQFFAEGDPPPSGQGGDPDNGGQQSGGAGSGEPPALTLESVQAFLTEQDAGKSWLSSYADSRVTDAIKTYETKTLPKKLDDEIAKRYPPETEDQKKLRALQDQFDNMAQEKERERMLNYALKEAGNYGIPGDIVDHFIGSTEEETKAGLTKLNAAIEARVEAQVNERLKGSARDPKDPKLPGDALTMEKLKTMSTDEIAALDQKEVDRVLSGK